MHVLRRSLFGMLAIVPFLWASRPQSVKWQVRVGKAIVTRDNSCLTVSCDGAIVCFEGDL